MPPGEQGRFDEEGNPAVAQDGCTEITADAVK
jgi:hypothetical protein